MERVVPYSFEEFLTEGMGSGSWVPVQPPRPLTSEEDGVIRALLAYPFPGHDALVRQVGSVRVLFPAAQGGHDIKMSPDRRPELAADVGARGRVPVEGRGRDAVGREVQVPLHVVEGFLGELEVLGNGDDPVGLPLLEGLYVYQPRSADPVRAVNKWVRGKLAQPRQQVRRTRRRSDPDLSPESFAIRGFLWSVIGLLAIISIILWMVIFGIIRS